MTVSSLLRAFPNTPNAAAVRMPAMSCCTEAKGSPDARSALNSFRDTRESARCKVGSEFVDGSYPSRVRNCRSGTDLAAVAADNRVGRAVRESATFQPKAFGREEVG